MPVTATPVECDIRIEPNFLVRTGDQAEGRSVSLETLAWRADAPEDATADRDE